MRNVHGRKTMTESANMGGYELSPRELVDTIQQSTVIEFMAAPGHELFYFEFDNIEYCTSLAAVQYILTAKKNARLSDMFLTKLLNVYRFANVPSIAPILPDFAAEGTMTESAQTIGHKLSTGELAYTIQKSQVIEFVSAPGHELFYFKFDNMEYCTSLFAVKEILTNKKYSIVLTSFLTKLIDVFELARVPSMTPLLPGYGPKSEPSPSELRQIRGHANAILKATTITFMSEPGWENGFVYFEFDGEEYVIPDESLQYIVSEPRFAKAYAAFSDKLTNFNDFITA